MAGMASTASAPAPAIPSSAPKRAGLVLLALILVAAVANLNLAVANVALPDIADAFDASQTQLNLVAVSYSLGLAMSVLYLGALGDRYGRKMMLLLGVLISVPACLIAAWAPNVQVLIGARLLGGVSAGMAYPTTLALITALWTGPARTKSIALWSALGGAISALGPLTAGALLEHFWWGSVFLITLPLAVVAFALAVVLVPAHVNETTDPVDNLGGILSIVLVASVVLAINFAPVPNKGALVLGLAAIAIAAGVGFVLRERHAKDPLYDLDIAARPTFWVAACAGIVVFGTLMGAMFVGQQYLQNVLGYSSVDAGAAILPAVFFMVIAAPRSAKLVETKGARYTLLLGYACCMLGFVTMLLLWNEDSPVRGRGHGVCVGRARCGLRGDARVPLAHRLGPGEAGGHGVGHRRPPARPGRRHHAVDPRRAAHGRLRIRVRVSDRRRSGREPGQRQRAEPAREVVRRCGGRRQAVPAVRAADHRRGEVVVPRRCRLGLHRGHRGDRARGDPGVLQVPQARARA